MNGSSKQRTRSQFRPGSTRRRSEQGAGFDRRLLGTWRSDRRRTMREWIWKKGVTAKQRKFTAGIFGHLVVRYTRRRLHSEFNRHRDAQRYEVIGSDSDSAAIMTYVGWMEEQRIYHIHFEDEDHYWISLGRQREWFKRVGPA